MMLDQAIRRAGLQAPPVEPDEADTPVGLNPPMTIDLRSIPVGSVVWCTGYTDDFSWLPPALVNAEGRPQHRDGAAPLPGVWYVGLRWLTHRASGNFLGFPTDAAAAADAVVAHLTEAPSPPWRQLRGDLFRHVVGLTSRVTAEPSMASPPGGDAGTALPGHHRRHRQPHRRRHRAGRLPAGRLRTLLSLERVPGSRLLHRTSRTVPRPRPACRS